jgi:hypothetical protein
MWQGPPLPSRAVQVQDGIDHFTHLDRSWTPTWLGGRDKRLKDRPFLLGHIAGIGSSAQRRPPQLFMVREFLAHSFQWILPSSQSP